jgi:hypothetical protein
MKGEEQWRIKSENNEESPRGGFSRDLASRIKRWWKKGAGIASMIEATVKSE